LISIINNNSLEEVVEPWIDQLSIHLDKLYPSKQQAPTQNKSEEPVEENTKLPNSCFVKVTLTQGTVQPSLRSPPSPIHRSYDVNTPYHARMIGARYLTTSGSEKQVLHVELDLGNSGITYAPGDAIGILPENDPEMVDELLKRLNLFEQKDHFINTECSDAEKLSLYPKHLNVCQDDRRVTVRELFLKYIDLSATVNTTTIRALADHCTDRMQRQDLLMLSSPSVNPTAYRVQIQHQSANILDMLKWYPSCQPPLNKILQVSQPMRPRYYSIACSPLRHPNHVHIAFTLVKFETPPPYRLEKHGCCTRWLGKRVQDFLTRDPRVYVPMFLKNTPEFRLPSDVETPMILIGPGTGVAPFRSFLQHRECVLNARVDRDTFTSQDWRGKNKADSNWLFYGCRSRDLDFLYRQDLRNFERDSPVALNLLVASSREADCSGGMWYGGMYVQDYLKEYSGTILELMQKHGGFLYVCGDAHGMAKDVHRVLRGLIEDELGLETEQAEQIISKWENDGRYQKDVW
jgi:sulfite reductase alpha subunit-like flavoprotein